MKSRRRRQRRNPRLSSRGLVVNERPVSIEDFTYEIVGDQIRIVPKVHQTTRPAAFRSRSRAYAKKAPTRIYVDPIGKDASGRNSTGLWVKRDNSTGRFVDIKQSGGTFEGIQRER